MCDFVMYLSYICYFIWQSCSYDNYPLSSEFFANVAKTHWSGNIRRYGMMTWPKKTTDVLRHIRVMCVPHEHEWTAVYPCYLKFHSVLYSTMYIWSFEIYTIHE